MARMKSVIFYGFIGCAVLACLISAIAASAPSEKNNHTWLTQPPSTRRTDEVTASSNTTLVATIAMTMTSRTTAPINTTTSGTTTMPAITVETTSATTAQSTTMTTAMQNITSAPTTNGTGAGTTSESPTGQGDIIPSFQVTNSDGEVCMLFKFSAVLKIKYETKSNGTQEAVIPITKTSEPLGFFVKDTERDFSLLYPKMLDYILIWGYGFRTETQTTYSVYKPSVLWFYREPAFAADAVNYGKQENITFTDLLYKNGTIGKSFKCQSMTLRKGPVTLLMEDVLFQPYADRSSDKGHFGDEVETCPAYVPTTSAPTTPTMPTTSTPPTPRPYQMSVGEIVGIAAGALVAVVLAVLLTVCAMKRRKRQIQYGNL